MRYFLVDDDRASRLMLSTIINDSGSGTVIGEAENGEDAIPNILMLRPDFVLIDLLMPKLDGISTIQKLHETKFSGQFIMLIAVPITSIAYTLLGEATRHRLKERGIEIPEHQPKA